jgi:signal transduction histidine kinase
VYLFFVKDDDIITEIKDNGTGISEDKLDFVFNEYETSGLPGKGHEKPVGLRLTIVKKLVNTHKGRIFVESKLGEGSVFTFTLPLNKMP